MGRTYSLILVSMLVSSIFMIVVPVHSVAAEPVRVYVDPTTVVDPPTFFNVSVKIDNVQSLAGIQLAVSWDPSLLNAVNMTDVIFHQVTPQSAWDNIWEIQHEIDNVVGRARYGYTFVNINNAIAGGYCPISGNFTIFVILFQVIGVGNCTLHIAVSKLGNSVANPIVHDDTDGFFSNSIPPSIPPIPSDHAQILFYVDPLAVKNESLTINSTFSVAIELDSIADHSGFVSYAINLFWNSTLLKFVSVTDVMFHEVVPESEWAKIWMLVWLSNTTGAMTVGCELPPGYGPIFGNHTAAIVTFQVINVGKCPLLLNDSRATGLQAATPLIGTWKIAHFSNTMSGDLNGDGRVDLFDALLLAKSFGSRPDLQSWNEDADVNGDGLIDIYDALLLCRSFGHST